jgi:NADH:ubiquinone oxidoreductase subunit C
MPTALGCEAMVGTVRKVIQVFKFLKNQLSEKGGGRKVIQCMKKLKTVFFILIDLAGFDLPKASQNRLWKRFPAAGGKPKKGFGLF